MSATITLAAASPITVNPWVTGLVFGCFVAATLSFVIYKTRTTNQRGGEFYTGGAQFSGFHNGAAVTGDTLSAAAFLGVTGAIATTGYDGFLYSVGMFVALLLALTLVAEPLRNTGRFTIADVISYRLNQRPVRLAAALSTVAVSLFYLVAQMAGAGGLVALLLGISGRTAQIGVVVGVGALMIVYVLVGGMKGTTYVQMVKAMLLLATTLVLVIAVFLIIGGGPQRLFALAIEEAGTPAILQPGMQYGTTAIGKLDFISLGLTLVLGTAGLPHVMMRFYTVPDAQQARRSMVWFVIMVGSFFAAALFVGLGAMVIVGRETILAAPGRANSAVLLLAHEIGGPVVMAFVSAVAFATILAVVAGIAITASASVAHDVYNTVIRKGQATVEEQVRVSRVTVVVIGVLAIILGIGAIGQNIAFLASLAFGIAASANLPTILFSLYWRRFTTTGALASIYAGLISAVVLIVLSPAMTGAPQSLFPQIDIAVIPLTSPGMISIAIGFAAGIIGTYLSPPETDAHIAAEMEVRAMTGATAGRSV